MQWIRVPWVLLAVTIVGASPVTVIAETDANRSDREVGVFLLGNSYTATAVPQSQILSQLLRSRGAPARAAHYTIGGETLRGHLQSNLGALPDWRERDLIEQKRAKDKSADEIALALRAKRSDWAVRRGALDSALSDGAPWDFVVLQPGKGMIEPGAYDLFAATRELAANTRALNPSSELVLYAPWPAPSQDLQADGSGVARRLAREVDLRLAPVGAAVLAAHAARPDLRILNSVGDPHPDIHGAYLIACVLYAALTEESPIGLPATLATPWVGHPNHSRHRTVEPFEIQPADVVYLQQLAWDAYRCRFDDGDRHGGVCPS